MHEYKENDIFSVCDAAMTHVQGSRHMSFMCLLEVEFKSNAGILPIILLNIIPP